MGNLKSKYPRYVVELVKLFKEESVKIGYGDNAIHIMSIDDELYKNIGNILPSSFSVNYRDNGGVKNMLITSNSSVETLYVQIVRLGYPPSEHHNNILHRTYQL